VPKRPRTTPAARNLLPVWARECDKRCNAAQPRTGLVAVGPLTKTPEIPT